MKTAIVVHTLMRVASLKNTAITVTATVGVCIISVVKDQKLTVTALLQNSVMSAVITGRQVSDTLVMVVTKKASALLKVSSNQRGVENPTPRVEKPDVNNTEGSGATMTAIGLLGGAAAILAGVSVVTLRELSAQHKARSEA